MNRPLAFVITLLVGCAAVGPQPERLDGSLHTVASTGEHRFLAYRVCSPEHCWSQAYLQWIDSADGAVVRTTEVPELGYGTMVEAARWIWTQDGSHLEVVVVPSHGNPEPEMMVVSPGAPGEYVASKR